MHEIGRKVPDSELIDAFPPKEGELNFYYGQIGSGKTYGATSDAIDDAKRGAVVYTTWPIDVESFDDRESLFMVFMNTILFRKRFYRIPLSSNIHFIDVEKGEVDGVYTFDPSKPSAYVDYLNSLKNCIIYIDEAWRVVDSYMPTRDFNLEIRSLILVTRHKFRTINLIAQRPTSVQVTARANVNRFYKFVKIANWPWVRFARYEFQDMSGETVDETKEPVSVKTYWGKSYIFNAYNSFYYGGANNSRHKLELEAWDLTFKEKLVLFKRYFKRYFQVIHRVIHSLNRKIG